MLFLSGKSQGILKRDVCGNHEEAKLQVAREIFLNISFHDENFALYTIFFNISFHDENFALM